MRILRWLLIVPAVFIGWYAGLLSGITVYKINEWLCPAEYIVSGMCYAPWSSYIHEFAVIFGAMVAASLIVALPAVIAPSHRRIVASVAYTLGLMYAVYFIVGGGSEMWIPAAAAISAGGAMLWLICAIFSRRSNNTR